MNMTKKHINKLPLNKLPVDDKIIGLSLIFTNQFVKDAIEQFFRSSNYSLVTHDVSYVRYKPGTSCIVTYKVVLLNSITHETFTSYFYAKGYSLENYELAKDKALGLHLAENKQDVVSLCFDSTKIIFYPFYADSEINGLDSILDSRKLRRVIYDYDLHFKNNEYRVSHKNMKFEILRYKPEKRALLKVETVCTHLESGNKEKICYYIKCDTSKKGRAVFELLDNISKNISNIVTPIHYDADKQFLIYKDAQAEDVSSIIDCNKFQSVNRMAASLITEIHNLSIDSEIFEQVVNIENNALTTIRSLKSILPDSHSMLEDIEKEIKAASISVSESKKVLIHGDFSYEQLLFDGKRIKILDFDRYSFGNIYEDIGNYIAHLLYKEVFALEFDAKKYIIEFIDSYSKEATIEIDRIQLKNWVGRSLLSLSIKPFRIYEHNWNEKTNKILKVVLDVLKDKSTYGI